MKNNVHTRLQGYHSSVRWSSRISQCYSSTIT